MGKALQLCGTKLFWAERIRTFQFIMYIFEEMALKIAFYSKKKKIQGPHDSNAVVWNFW